MQLIGSFRCAETFRDAFKVISRCQRRQSHVQASKCQAVPFSTQGDTAAPPLLDPQKELWILINIYIYIQYVYICIYIHMIFIMHLILKTFIQYDWEKRHCPRQSFTIMSCFFDSPSGRNRHSRCSRSQSIAAFSIELS